MKYFYTALLLICVLFSCTTQEDFTTKFEGLKSNQARIEININDLHFYSQDNVFIPEIGVSDKYLSLNLSDQYGGNFQLQISKVDWFLNKKEAIMVSGSMLENYPNYGVMLIGKRDEKSMTGYVLSRGRYQWLEFTKEFAVLSCEGFVVKPQDAAVEENEIPFKGYIYIKEPSFTLNGIEEQSLF